MPLPLLGAFLATSIGALVRKAMVAIGLGTITYTGLQSAFNGVQASVIANYGALDASALQIADLAGVGQAIGIILGAMAARVGIAVLSHFGKVL